MPASFLVLWSTVKLGSKGETLLWLLRSHTARWQALTWWSLTQHEERTTTLHVLHLLGLVALLCSLAVISLLWARTLSSLLALVP